MTHNVCYEYIKTSGRQHIYDNGNSVTPLNISFWKTSEFVLSHKIHGKIVHFPTFTHENQPFMDR